MSQNRWIRIEQLFAEALTQPATARDAFLERSCGGDTDLRRELDELLRSHDTSGVLDSALRAADSVPVQPSLAAGTHLGSWRVDALIGRGGMGEVYAAARADAAFEQRAALKLLRYEAAGQMDRFHAERRILARLEHPGIARLLDGGMTADGRPYTVMEYVEGHSLTDYCRAHSSTLRERLALFAQVCDAVAFAHRNLVIHRDLKPDNILVDAQGTVKLLDFGIAKLLDAAASVGDGDNTMAPFTPDYAAPEQLTGQPVTTATDIYALGVLLFELLSDERPLRMRGLPSTQAMQLLLDRTAPSLFRIAKLNSNPPIPARLLAGDLDAIVAKCLRKEPAHRYETINALMRDIESHLHNEPVSAREGARMYVFGRLLRRYRWAVAGVAVLIITLAAGLAGTIWQAQRAQTQAARANAVRDFLVSLFEIAEAGKPQDLRPTVEEIVEQGGDRILADRAMPQETKADLLGVLSRVALSMGAQTQAQELTQALLLLSDQLYQSADSRWISARHLRALSLIDRAEFTEATTLLEPLQDALLQRGDPLGVEALLTLALAMSEQGGRVDEALALQREITALAMKDVKTQPRSALQAMIAEANHFGGLHRYKESLERSERALTFWKSRGLPLSSEVLWLHASIGNSASALGDAVRGEAAYREAIALSERLYKRPHQATAWFVGLLGSYLVALGRYDEAESYVQRGLAMRRDLLGDAHPDTLFAVAALARLRASQTRTDEALTVLSEGVSICEKARLQHQACVRLLQTRGQVHAMKADFEAAQADLNAAITVQRKISGEDGAMVATQFGALSSMQRLGGRYEEAIVTAEHALALFEKAGGGYFGEVADARYQRARANFELGKHQATLDEITEVEALYSKQSRDDFIIRIRMLSLKARALSRLNRTDEARQTAAAALTLVNKAQGVDPKMIAGLKLLDATGEGY